MKLTINYQLSPEGQKVSLLAGGNGKAEQFVEGEISLGDLSSPLVAVKPDGELYTLTLQNREIALDAPGWREPQWVHTRTPLKAPIEFGSAWRLVQEIEARITAEKARLQPAYDAALNAYREREAHSQAEKAERKRKDLEYERERQRRQQEAEAALQNWGQDHGSELLVARLKEGFDWKGLARREYADNVLSSVGLSPGLPWSDCEDRERPSLSEIDTLRRYRDLLGDRAAVSLAWYSPTAVDDLGYPLEDQPTPCTVLVVVIATPDGLTVSRIIRDLIDANKD